MTAALTAIVIGALALAGSIATPVAQASQTQKSVIQDNTALETNMVGALQTMRDLGASIVKFPVAWNMIAPNGQRGPKPAHFTATNPRDYPSGAWTFLDTLDRDASADGLTLGLMLTGKAPRWAEGPGMPHTSNCPCRQWKPSGRAFGQFVQAIGTRFDGSFVPGGASSPLPRVSWWTIWNEPNYGPNLAPQARDDDKIELSPAEYRGLLDGAWHGLSASGHTPSSDTILFGELAPRGLNHPIGNFSGMKPLRFLRALYCVNSSYHQLRGSAARVRGCPTTAGGSRVFRARNPALFKASGFADHPYAQGVPPTLPTYACGRTFCVNRRTHRSDPDYADFAELGRLGRTLDRLVSVYRSHVHFPIWNTEFGYWTRPPEGAKGALPPQTAALYMNWAEYLSYNNPRIASYDQYVLRDPSNGKWAEGLELASGAHLPGYDAFQMPVFMPSTTASSPKDLTVWGDVRPAAYGLLPTSAEVQFEPAGSGSWTPWETVAVTNPLGYYKVQVPFARSGSVRVAWTPQGGHTEYSRTQAITVK